MKKRDEYGERLNRFKDLLSDPARFEELDAELTALSDDLSAASEAINRAHATINAMKIAAWMRRIEYLEGMRNL